MGVLHHLKSTIDFILFVLTLLGLKWVDQFYMLFIPKSFQLLPWLTSINVLYHTILNLAELSVKEIDLNIQFSTLFYPGATETRLIFYLD